ncbi:MAG: asparaginase [Ideonella sp. WA131b]|jgi:L-asparaginase|nr:asparaginase [Ideonella sp. WA131b]
MPSTDSFVVVIGTGGTIAGAATRPGAHLGYQAGALAAQALVDAVPALAGLAVEAHSLAQLDSCDMDHVTWVALASAVREHLARAEVAGVVVTHGTDTLEETATFLHHTVAATKPVVLTAAMRPATAPSPDGPQNLLDAVTLAGLPGAQGVLLAFGGAVYSGTEARKVHGYRAEAFSGGDAGPLALWQDGRLRLLRAWPAVGGDAAEVLAVPVADWPVVDIVTSHAGARGAAMEALVAAGALGIVIAGTGNGSVHHTLLAAAKAAQAQGVRVWRASRCVAGGVVEGEGRAADALPVAGDATPAQTRVHLLLELLRSS